MKYKIILLLIITLIMSSFALTQENIVIEFEDDVFENLVRDEINKSEGEITASDVENITIIRGTFAGVSNITGIEYMTNLTEIVLNHNSIEDISNLSGLVNLERLNMGSNPITDVSSLVDLDKLYYIHFRNTRIKDLTPFLELESLESLNINDNKIDLRKGTENLKVVNTLIEKGVNVEYKRGNTY